MKGREFVNQIIKANINGITPKHVDEYKNYEYFKYEVTDSRQKYEAASPNEGNQTVVAFYALPPGKSNYPFHYHTTNEEVFYIMSGEAALETPGGRLNITAGDVIVCPAGKDGGIK